jgi:hypothetical protein
MGGYVTGWKLPGDERERLLERFPPRYEQTVADHVTLQVGASEDTPLPRQFDSEIVGHADDGQSLECLVVAVGGTTDRPDGSTYHITWSLGPDRKPKESNDVLRELGWKALDRPIPVELEPSRFEW